MESVRYCLGHETAAKCSGIESAPYKSVQIAELTVQMEWCASSR